MLRHRAVLAIGDPYAGAPVLYLDRVLQGKPELLLSVPAAMVLEVRYLSATEGKSEMGTFHPGGVIAVRTRR